MTLNQYKQLSKAIADKIIELGGNPNRTRNLKSSITFKCEARDPKSGVKTTLDSGNTNATIMFDTISNPNNPNYKFRTLKPGSISFYDSESNVNVDLTEYNFDSHQFAELLSILEYNWQAFE